MPGNGYTLFDIGRERYVSLLTNNEKIDFQSIFLIENISDDF